MAMASAQCAFLLLSFIILVIASPQTVGREGGREEVGAKQIVECMCVCAYVHIYAYVYVHVCACVCMCEAGWGGIGWRESRFYVPWRLLGSGWESAPLNGQASWAAAALPGGVWAAPDALSAAFLWL